MENVDSITFKHAIGDFKQWIRLLDSLGYTNSYEIINAKDHGVAQNRKRLFLVSTLHYGKLIFPKGRPLDKRLKDYLEEDVDESFYLSPERIAGFRAHKRKQKAKGNGFGLDPQDPERERESATPSLLTLLNLAETASSRDPKGRARGSLA